MTACPTCRGPLDDLELGGTREVERYRRRYCPACDAVVEEPATRQPQPDYPRSSADARD